MDQVRQTLLSYGFLFAESVTDQAWQKIAEQGLLVLSFGLAIVYLVKANRALHAYYEGEPAKGDKESKPGRIETLQKEAQNREDQIRKDFDKKEKELRDALAAVYKELNDTLRGEFED